MVPFALTVGVGWWAVAQIAAPPSAPATKRSGFVITGAAARPLATPPAAQATATACPLVPSLSWSTPPGVVFSPPSLAPADLWSVNAAGEVHSGDWCSYPVSVSSLSP